MLLIAFLLAAMSTSLIQAIRAPQQGTLQYKEPDGTNKDWKSYAGRQEASRKVSSIPKQKTLEPYQQSYKPFSSVPDHIKQIIYQSYQPQSPYINPDNFFYRAPTNLQDRSGSESTPNKVNQDQEKPRIAYRPNYEQKTQTIAHINRKQSGIIYNNDAQESSTIKRPHYGSRSPLQTRLYQEQVKRSPEENVQDQQHQAQGHESMPAEIQMILQWQSEIPYNVLANEILFQPKKPFVPKPLSDDLKSSVPYPSKIYYIKSDGEILDNIPALGIGPVAMNYKSS